MLTLNAVSVLRLPRFLGMPGSSSICTAVAGPKFAQSHNTHTRILAFWDWKDTRFPHSCSGWAPWILQNLPQRKPREKLCRARTPAVLSRCPSQRLERESCPCHRSRFRCCKNRCLLRLLRAGASSASSRSLSRESDVCARRRIQIHGFRLRPFLSKSHRVSSATVSPIQISSASTPLIREESVIAARARGTRVSGSTAKFIIK
jgi:hypothetical protein